MVEYVQTLLWVPLLMVGVEACGDKQKRADPVDGLGRLPSQDASPSDAGVRDSARDAVSSKTFCQDYCQALVDKAAGCENYNRNGRCEEICKFYMASACETTWEAFAGCMRDSPAAECTQPDVGKLTLVISACHDEFQAWDDCRVRRDAGICPY